MNKSLKYLLLTLPILLFFTSCKDDLTSAGSSTLGDEDLIVVGCDTFSVSSKLTTANPIYSSPDSLLLGETDTKFGTLHADILTQFACPEGYVYPEGAEVDSVCLYLYYSSYFGDPNSPLAISAYEMDKGTFSYDSAYTSAIDLTQYCSLAPETEVAAKERIITANYHTDSVQLSNSVNTYIPYIRIRTTDEFANKIFNCRDFSSQQAFQKQFHGLYITSTFGSATVLNVKQLSMSVFYHFDYQKLGQDTTVSDCKSFYANTEVRQVNRIQYSNTNRTQLEAANDSVNYIVSPANIYTSLKLPLHEMGQSIENALTGKRAYVNMAQLRVDVLNVYSGSAANITPDDWAQPAPYMLLCKEEAVDRFFRKKELPNDTCAILSSLNLGVDSLGNKVYYYSYDLSTLLTQQLRQDTASLDTLRMTLVPVSVTMGQSNSYYSSQQVVSAVAPLQTITATEIRSAQSADNPMKLEVIYSGF